MRTPWCRCRCREIRPDRIPSDQSGARARFWHRFGAERLGQSDGLTCSGASRDHHRHQICLELAYPEHALELIVISRRHLLIIGHDDSRAHKFADALKSGNGQWLRCRSKRSRSFGTRSRRCTGDSAGPRPLPDPWSIPNRPPRSPGVAPWAGAGPSPDAAAEEGPPRSSYTRRRRERGEAAQRGEREARQILDDLPGCDPAVGHGGDHGRRSGDHVSPGPDFWVPGLEVMIHPDRSCDRPPRPLPSVRKSRSGLWPIAEMTVSASTWNSDPGNRLRRFSGPNRPPHPAPCE